MRGKPATIPLELRLPNEGSKLATPSTLSIDLHYAQLRIWERWTWERFSRLCTFLKVTPAELASIACIPHNQLDAFQQRNRVMQSGSANRAAAMVLTLLEAHVCAEFTKDVLENPFPNLGSPNSGSPTSANSQKFESSLAPPSQNG